MSFVNVVGILAGTNLVWRGQMESTTKLSDAYNEIAHIISQLYNETCTASSKPFINAGFHIVIKPTVTENLALPLYYHLKPSSSKKRCLYFHFSLPAKSKARAIYTLLLSQVTNRCPDPVEGAKKGGKIPRNQSEGQASTSEASTGTDRRFSRRAALQDSIAASKRLLEIIRPEIVSAAASIRRRPLLAEACALLERRYHFSTEELHRRFPSIDDLISHIEGLMSERDRCQLPTARLRMIFNTSDGARNQAAQAAIIAQISDAVLGVSGFDRTRIDDFIAFDEFVYHKFA
ncbi:hypothetical protein C8J56DRAFT_458762 [Mycena floridula]|nr:hypothetical protein C8J56DRAFT_458762 [Mycena floridula]